MASQDDMRIGDRERDEVTQALHEAFAQGRITRDELDERLDAALSARTGADLRRVTADLPGSYGYRDWRGPQDMPWHGAGGRQWSGHRGDLATWGWQLAESRRRDYRRDYRRRVRGGRPPVVFLALAVLVIAALVSGTAWPLFAAVKLLFLAWLAIAVLGLIHRRHRHLHGHGHWRQHRRGGIGS